MPASARLFCVRLNLLLHLCLLLLCLIPARFVLFLRVRLSLHTLPSLRVPLFLRLRPSRVLARIFTRLLRAHLKQSLAHVPLFVIISASLSIRVNAPAPSCALTCLCLVAYPCV